MKYIRTEDGRIMEIHLEEMSLPATIGVHTEECEIGEYHGIEVVKQADTIEELCDEFVYVKKYSCKGEFIKKRYIYDRFENATVYGAIWTDKGLIYVAKMNNEGDLELL